MNCALALDSTLGGARASALLGKAVPLNQVPGVFGKAAFDGTASTISGVQSAFGTAGSRGVVVGTDGTQVWVSTRNGVIQNAGVNTTPRVFTDLVGP